MESNTCCDRDEHMLEHRDVTVGGRGDIPGKLPCVDEIKLISEEKI